MPEVSLPVFFGGFDEGGGTQLSNSLGLDQSFSEFSYSLWNVNFSGIGSQDSQFVFTLKEDKSQLDSEATLQINLSGIITLNKSGVSINTGQLSYTSGNAGTINLVVPPTITSQIKPKLYVWDIKNIGNNVQIRTSGKLKVKNPVTKYV